jgi:hypothetical protein
VFGDREGDTGDIHFLKAITTDQALVNLTCDCHQRYGIE